MDRCLVTFLPLDHNRCLELNRWFARADQFWAGATFQVRTGRAAGTSGRIVASRSASVRGLPEFSSADPLPSGLAAGDRIALTKITDGQLPTQWWIPSPGQVAISTQTRPGSPGVRSVELRGRPNAPAEIHSYLDTIGGRAGVLLPIAGKWRLSFWCRSLPGSELSVRFARGDAPAWLQRKVAVRPEWHLVTFDFDGGERGNTGTLDLQFQTLGDLLLDDVELRRTGIGQNAFRDEVVQSLETLRPGYLRDWQGQLGDTLQNRLAAPEGRRSWRYRPGGDEATDFGYSLPEFLDLCKKVQARPWIVAPTTLSDAEWATLGRYLRSRAGEDRFPEILIEFGNENWNDIFSAAGILDPVMHAQAAGRGFGILLESAGDLPIRPVVNAQYANPQAVTKFAAQLSFPAIVAVAPYFFRELNAPATRLALPALFSSGSEVVEGLATQLRGMGRDLASYEVNLHTTEGDAPGRGSNSRSCRRSFRVSAGHPSLNGLPRALTGNVSTCCPASTINWPTAGLCAIVVYLARRSGLLAGLRPTGLAVALQNQAAAGDLHRCDSYRPDINVAPFRSAAGWSVAVASGSSEPRALHIEFAQGEVTLLTLHCLTLRSPDPAATNEEGEQVTIAEPAGRHHRPDSQSPASRVWSGCSAA